MEGIVAKLVEHDTSTKLEEHDIKCTIIVCKGASKKCEHGTASRGFIILEEYHLQ